MKIAILGTHGIPARYGGGCRPLHRAAGDTIDRLRLLFARAHAGNDGTTAVLQFLWSYRIVQCGVFFKAKRHLTASASLYTNWRTAIAGEFT